MEAGASRTPAIADWTRVTSHTPAANSSWALPGGLSAMAVTMPQTTAHRPARERRRPDPGSSPASGSHVGQRYPSRNARPDRLDRRLTAGVGRRGGDVALLIVGVTVGGATAFSAPLDHGADPDTVVHDQGFRAVQPLEAGWLGADLALRLQVRPLRGEPRPEPLPPRTEAGLIISDDVVPVTRQRVAAYAVVLSQRGLLATEYSHQTAVPGRWDAGRRAGRPRVASRVRPPRGHRGDGAADRARRPDQGTDRTLDRSDPRRPDRGFPRRPPGLPGELPSPRPGRGCWTAEAARPRPAGSTWTTGPGSAGRRTG